MKLKNSYLFFIIPLLAAVMFFAFQNTGSNETDLNNTVFASKQNPNLEVKEDVSPEIAQENVNFNLVIPEAPEGLNTPITNVAQPPKEAVSDENAIKQLTRIESYYISKDKKDEGIAIVQANNEIVQLDGKGEPLKAEIIEIDGMKINSYDCDCKPKKTILWWYDGQVTTEITVYGEKNIQKANTLIKKILKK